MPRGHDVAWETLLCTCTSLVDKIDYDSWIHARVRGALALRARRCAVS